MTPYYNSGGITIYLGDCRDVLPHLEPVDLVFTSPPYNLGISTGGGLHYYSTTPFGSRGGGGKWPYATLADGYGLHNDAMPYEEYTAWQSAILAECWALLTDDGAIYYNHKPRVQAGLLQTPLDFNPGLPVRQIVIWARAGGINFAPTHYVPTHEWIVIFAKPAFRLRDKAASGAGDVWYISQEANTDHPAPFPLALPKRAIETTRAVRVLDPFMGSGTTLRAAKDLGRKAIGIEIEERYVEIAIRRLEQEVLPLGNEEQGTGISSGVLAEMAGVKPTIEAATMRDMFNEIPASWPAEEVR